MKNIVITGYLALSFYVLGALMMENDVNYTTWYQIDAGSFRGYHHTLQGLLQFFLFAPMGIHLLLNGILIWIRPPIIPRWLVVVVLILNSYVIAESLLVQVPIHEALERSYDQRLIDLLLLRHRIFRLPAELLVGGLNLWVFFRMMRH